MLNYKIEGGNLPVVICYPKAGQTLCTESGNGDKGENGGAFDFPFGE